MKLKELQEYIERKKFFDSIGREKVLEFLAAAAFTSPAQLADIVEEDGKQKIRWKSFDELTDEVKAAVSILKNTPSGINVETLDRLKAADMLMKHLKITDKGEGCVVIEGEDKLEE